MIVCMLSICRDGYLSNRARGDQERRRAEEGCQGHRGGLVDESGVRDQGDHA